MKRIISLVLMLAIMLLSLTSCARLSAAMDLQDAYPTDEQDYTVKSEIDFDIDDKNIISLYPTLAGDVKTTATKCGENKKTVIETPIEGRRMVSEQTLVGNTYYIKASLTAAGTVLESQRLRIELTDSQREEIFASEGSETGFGIGDFGRVKREKVDGAVVYTLSEFKDGSVSGLEDLVRGFLSSVDAEVKTVKMEITLTLVDGVVSTETVECEFSIRDGSYEFNLPMTMVNTYTMNPDEITVPINASNYQLVPYDMIFGE